MTNGLRQNTPILLVALAQFFDPTLQLAAFFHLFSHHEIPLFLIADRCFARFDFVLLKDRFGFA